MGKICGTLSPASNQMASWYLRPVYDQITIHDPLRNNWIPPLPSGLSGITVRRNWLNGLTLLHTSYGLPHNSNHVTVRYPIIWKCVGLLFCILHIPNSCYLGKTKLMVNNIVLCQLMLIQKRMSDCFMNKNAALCCKCYVIINITT